MMLRRHLPRRNFHRPKLIKSNHNTPTLGGAISKRDFIAAIAILELNRDPDELEVDKLLWLGYCHFHNGNYKKAQAIYTDLLSGDHGDCPMKVKLYLACIYFYMQMFEEAEEAALSGPASSLKNRLLLHIALKNRSDESKVHFLHHNLGDTDEDKLTLAAMHYSKHRFQEAIDVCKKLLIQNRDNLAINVYVAMCYFRLDYYDVSLEILSVYLQTYPDSPVAKNLKACNHFRLYNGKAAMEELNSLGRLSQVMKENDLIRHNMVVFSDGENALQVLPPLIGFIPEARLNLAIYYLKKEDVSQAAALLEDLKPSTPQEYVLQAIINAHLGQKNNGNTDALRLAQTYFQSVGASPSECDTIPGRQCMASCFYLLKQFDDVNIYLNSVKSYMSHDDDFHWNYGISLATTGNYKSAQETFLMIQNEHYKKDIIYMSWLSRCFIMDGFPDQAWELYSAHEGIEDSCILLQLIANECYRMGHFLTAAKAFDILEKSDPDPDFWEGKRGACVGVFQEVITCKQRNGQTFRFQESERAIRDVMTLLRTTNNPQSEFIRKCIRNWGRENGLEIN